MKKLLLALSFLLSFNVSADWIERPYLYEFSKDKKYTKISHWFIESRNNHEDIYVNFIKTLSDQKGHVLGIDVIKNKIDCENNKSTINTKSFIVSSDNKPLFIKETPSDENFVDMLELCDKNKTIFISKLIYAGSQIESKKIGRLTDQDKSLIGNTILFVVKYKFVLE